MSLEALADYHSRVGMCESSRVICCHGCGLSYCQLQAREHSVDDKPKIGQVGQNNDIAYLVPCLGGTQSATI